MGSIDRIKPQTEMLKFTAGVTFASSYHLHVFKTKSTKTEGHVGEIMTTLVAQVYHHFISQFKEKWGIMFSKATSTPNLYGSISDLSSSRPARCNFAEAPCLSLCTCKMQMTRFTPLCEAF